MLLKAISKSLPKLLLILDSEGTNFFVLFLFYFSIPFLDVVELKSFDDPEVLEDVKVLSKKLQQIGEEQHSPKLQIESLLLQSKLALLDFQIDAAQQMLQTANDLAIKGF